MNNKGISYLLILILGGILVTASGVYYASTIVESRVSTNARVAREVFYHTESAIYKTTTDFRNKGGSLLTPVNYTALLALTDGSSHTISNPYVRTRAPGTLSATVIYTCDSTETHTETELIDGFNYTLTTTEKTYTISSRGAFYKDGRRLLPREITMRAKTTHLTGTAPSIPGLRWDGFGYGMAGGAKLNFSGNAKVIGGGAFSNSTLNLGNAKNQLRIDGGEAYSAANITGVGKIVPRAGKTAQNPGQPSITFPGIDFPYYRSIADMVLPGNQTFPSYNGTWTDSNKDGQIIIFVDGNVKITGNFVNTQKMLLVVTGSVTISGCSQMGSATTPFGILAGGDINNKATGTADMNGFFYTTGSLALSGTFRINGALASRQDINLSGTVDVNYRPALSEGLDLRIDNPDSDAEDIDDISVEILMNTWQEVTPPRAP